MPDPDLFISSYGFKINNLYKGYILKSINSDHITIKRNKEYDYIFNLTFEATKSAAPPKSFYDSLVFDNKIIDSKYGNPYSCFLNRHSYRIEGNLIFLELRGYSYRM